MALTLSQLVDLAIGSDVPSVNFRHLRDVLVTVVKVLNISDVAAKTVAPVLHDVATNDRLQNGSVLSDDDNRVDEGFHIDDNFADTNDGEDGDSHRESKLEVHEDGVNEISILNDPGRGSPNIIIEKGHSARNKSGKISNKHENIPSRAIKTANSQSSVLFSKVQVLEEGLKSLQSIVGDVISNGDFGGKVSENLLEQLKNSEANMVRFDAVSLENNNCIQGSLAPNVTELQQQQQLVNITRRASARLSRECSGKTTSKRPVTQPITGNHGNRNGTSASTREKSGDKLTGGKNTPVGATMLEKAKAQRCVAKGGESNTGRPGVSRVTKDNQGHTRNEKLTSPITTHNAKVPEGGGSMENGVSQELNTDVSDDDNKMADLVEEEADESLGDPDDPMYPIRHELVEMGKWREKLMAAQEEFRLEIGTCKKSIGKIQSDIERFRMAKNAQDAERFNAVHHVHTLVMELDDKHTKTLNTVHNLVDEFNRHDRTFNEVFQAIEKLDESKVDNVMLSSEVGNKANKDELRDKVSLSTFDETFSLLDRGLSDALEKMANQMSMEEALRETLSELESGMESKLNREEMDKLKYELESRIKEVRAMQKQRELEGKPKIVGDPAGFKRKPETVRCISCDRDMEIGTTPSQVPPSLPKIQRLAGSHVNKTQPSRDKKPEENEYRSSKPMKAEILQGTAIQDLATLPISQRFCGGSHTTIIRGKQRSHTMSHFNDYIVIRNEPNSVVTLPPREFILPRESAMAGSQFLKQKLPAIPEAGGYMQSAGDISGFLSEGNENEIERSERFEKKRSIAAKIPVCKNEND